MAESVPEKLPTGTAAKVRKLLEVAQQRHTELGSVLKEIDTLLGGGVGIGDLLKQAEKAFEAAWSSRYPGAYLWQYAKDRMQMKRLIQSLGLEELGARFGRYVRNDDPFFTRARHSFGAFVASVNQHAAEGAAPGGDLDLEPLESDADATARNMRRVRGE